jgi:hypothetical protein
MVRFGAVATALALTLLALCSGCGGGSTPTKVTQSPFSPYVAIGDSYTAAPSSDDEQAGCARSPNNYPALVALDLHIPQFRDNSCAGARTGDLTRSQFDGVGPQVDGLDRKTRLVTVGIGGNDLNIATAIITLCPHLGLKHPGQAPCTDAAARHPGLLDSTLRKLGKRLDGVLHEVHTRAPNARVVVVGYPQVVPPQGHCKAYPAAAADYFYLRQLNSGLNDTIRAAARRAGDTFIDIWSASSGHDICADDPWIAPYSSDHAEAAPVHPVPAEQAAIARLVVAAVKKSGQGEGQQQG